MTPGPKLLAIYVVGSSESLYSYACESRPTDVLDSLVASVTADDDGKHGVLAWSIDTHYSSFATAQ